MWKKLILSEKDYEYLTKGLAGGVVSSFVSGVSYEILPLRIFSLVKTGVTPEVNALATIMIVLSLGLVILSQLITRKNNH